MRGSIGGGRLRLLVWAWSAAVLLVVIASWRDTRADASAPVRGKVVEAWTHRPLVGSIVAIGRQTTTTDKDGRFTIAGVPPAYDVLVADPDHAAVSVYRGLHRRDLLLEHRPHARDPGNVHGAALRGTLSGGGPFPLTSGSVQVQFSSIQVASSAGRHAGPRQMSTDPPPDTALYGPMDIRWAGPPSIRGELIALRKTPLPAAPWNPPDAGPCPPLPPRPSFRWSFGHEDVAVSTGEALTADLALKDIPSFKITLKITGELGDHMQGWSCYFSQPWPRAQQIFVDGADHAGRRDSLTYDLSVPDLRGTGASLCVDARYGWTFSKRCGIAPGQTVSLTGVAAPAFRTPANGSVLTPETRFTWDGSGHGIYALVFDVWSPTGSYPTVEVYTAERAATWPDLRAIGIAFPALRRAFPEGNAAYKCMIGILEPYATMDDAAGPSGFGATFPRDQRESFSPTIELDARPE